MAKSLEQSQPKRRPRDRKFTQREQRIAYLQALCRTVPYHIVEAVLDDPSDRAVSDRAFEGAVMFAHLAGFSAMCERLASSGPAGLSRLSEMLDELFRALLEQAIFPYRGYVMQFGGPELTVFFRDKDHDLRCAAAALACQRLMHGELGRLLSGKSGELSLRMGLATGGLVVASLGDLVRRATMIGGEAAERALRLMSAAEANAIAADAGMITSLSANAEVVERSEEGGVLRGLRRWPEGRIRRPRREKLLDRVDEKIALLEPFVPQPLSVRLRSGPEGWRFDGEQRQVIALIADVGGLEGTAQDAVLEPVTQQVARSLLRSFRRYGGVVVRTGLVARGYRVMALFGLHRPSEHDHERALLAALEVTSHVRNMASSHDLPLRIHMGLHAGRVYYGPIGSEHKYNITVVGDAVGVASRAVSAAKPFQVLATSNVMEEVSSEFRHLPLERVEGGKRGSTVPVLYLVQGTSSGEARYVQQRTRGRFCAGRITELTALRAAVDRALKGSGGVIGLSGASGMGKSLLLGPTIDAWIGGGGVGLLGRCRFATRTVPLAPVVAMFESFLGLQDIEEEEERRERIRRGFRSMGLTRGAPELVSLLQPVRRPDGTMEPVIDLADAHARDRVLASIVEFFGKRIAKQPMLYIMEDLHHGDTLTLLLIERLAELSRSEAFLGIATYRPTAALSDMRRGFDEEIQLGPLSSGQCADLAAHLLRAGEVDAELVGFLWQRSGGNPGFLAEIIRFSEDRQLIQRRGKLVTTRDPGVRLLDDAVPRTMAKVALARVDALGTAERQTLRAASVVGRRFGKSVLVAALQGDPEAISSALDSLEGQQMIAATAHQSDGYMFRSGALRAVTYGTIPQKARAQMHARVADFLEQLPAGDPRRSPASLATHRERAEQWVEAMRAYKHAAHMALSSGIDAECCELIEQWERMVYRASAQPSQEERSRMALMKFVATARQSNPTRTIRLGRELAAKNWEVLNKASRILVDYWLGHALVASGRPRQSRKRLRRVIESSAPAGQRCDAAWLIAASYQLSHQPDKSIQWLEEGERLAQGDPERLRRIELVRANLYLYQGRIDEARNSYQKIENSTRGGADLVLESRSLNNVAYCDLVTCRFEEAANGFENALLKLRALRDWASEAQALTNLGQVHLWAERPVVAKPILEKAYALATDIGQELVAAEAQIHWGAAIAFAGELARGAEICRQGRARMERSGVREPLIAADLHLLQIALRRRATKEAIALFGRCKEHGEALKSFLLFQRKWEELSEQGRSARIFED